MQGTLIVEGAKYRGAITRTFIASIVCMEALVCKGALKYSAHSANVLRNKAVKRSVVNLTPPLPSRVGLWLILS